MLLVVAVSGAGVRLAAQTAPAHPTRQRPIVGVAFGGGSARGLAHVGILRWFEDHHVPIDRVAGTSMGGLIGGAFAAGMSAGELAALLARTDWDEMFGFSPFRYKNIRRKEDARAYPSHIEFGLRHGLAMPPALNNGQQVEFLLERIAGPYATIRSFDDLPTPFRAVAVDLMSARQVILDKGSLASAMRATMSLPAVFPPVQRDGRVLIDGGTMNNVPADVVRGMGADVVIAVNVGYMGETRRVSGSIFGLMGQAVDVMMQASTRAAMRDADIVINPALEGFGSLDWRRNEELAAEGYRAAEAMKDKLLPFVLDEPQWEAYQAERRSRRKSAWPVPEFLSIEGAVVSDKQRMERVLQPRVGQPLDVDSLETDLETFAGLDRYQTVGWQLEEVDGRPGLRVDARPKAYAPPFLMLGVTLQNTTTDDFEFRLAARYLTFDIVGSGSELRVDGSLGADPSIAAELYRPIGRTPLFVTAFTGVRRRTLNFVDDDIVVAQYSDRRAVVGFTAGANLGRDSDVRIGMTGAQVDTHVEAGSPGLPELSGRETRAELAWRYDGQDSPVVPAHGVRAVAMLEHIFSAPDAPPAFPTTRSNDGITQLDLIGSSFWSPRRRDRFFVAAGLGATSGNPLATEQFQLGRPLRLGAYDLGTLRGDNYGVVTLGYLRTVARLPDFLGGRVYLGGWWENGSAFETIGSARFHTNMSVGVIADTILGPALLAGSFDPQGAWRYYVALGRLF